MKRISAIAVLLLLVANAHAAACREEVNAPQLDAGSVLVVGELHGTREAPAYFFQMICDLLRTHPTEALIVALEYPSAEQAALDRYLDSSASNADERLLATPFWTREMQDGRSSRAIHELIASLRELRQRGADLSLIAIDDWQATDRTGAMAEAINRAMAHAPGARAVALVGNLHARKSGPASSISVAPSLLQRLRPPARSYSFRAHHGSHWACAPFCEETPLAGSPLAQSRRNPDMRQAASSETFDGLIDLGEVSPSAPAAGAANPPSGAQLP